MGRSPVDDGRLVARSFLECHSEQRTVVAASSSTASDDTEGRAAPRRPSSSSSGHERISSILVALARADAAREYRTVYRDVHAMDV